MIKEEYKMKWIKERREVSSQGTTITYRAAVADEDVTIESRKRHIPHANRTGTWDHTSYFVIRDGQELREFQSLRDAKDYAELKLVPELPFC